MNLRNRIPILAKALERATGFSAKRPLPNWSNDTFNDRKHPSRVNPDIVLFADTFNRYFEPENLRSAIAVYNKAKVSFIIAKPVDRK